VTASDASQHIQDWLIDESGARLGQPFDGVAGTFSEGLIAVRLAGKIGFLDRDGNVAVAAKLEEAHAFHEGLPSAAKGGLWGHPHPGGAWGTGHRGRRGGAPGGARPGPVCSARRTRPSS